MKTLADRYVACYKKAWDKRMQDEAIRESNYLALTHVRDFEYVPLPVEPMEITALKDSQEFKNMRPNDKREALAELWKDNWQFSETRQRVKHENYSNLCFLRDLVKYFGSHGDKDAVALVQPVLERHIEKGSESEITENFKGSN